MVSCWLLIFGPESSISPTFFSDCNREKSIHKPPRYIFLCQMRLPPQEIQEIFFRVFFLLPTWVIRSTIKAQILIKNDGALKKTLFDCKNLKLLRGVWKGAKCILWGQMSFSSFPEIACFHFGRKMQVFQLRRLRDFTLEAETLAVRIPG